MVQEFTTNASACLSQPLFLPSDNHMNRSSSEFGVLLQGVWKKDPVLNLDAL